MKVLAVAVLLAGAPAYIDELYPLQRFLRESAFIAEAVVEKADPATRTATARLVRTLKGRCPVEVFRINLSAGQEGHVDAVLPHFVPGAPLLVFSSAERRGEFYLNRFFLQCHGDPGQPAEKAWWNFTHVELRCNRTFNGPADVLIRRAEDALAGRAPAPAAVPELPAITVEALRKLPVWGRPAEAPLPPCFREAAAPPLPRGG